MPKSPTDIPHFAFTHHRIGIHREHEDLLREKPGQLVALFGVPGLSELDRDRNLGLAYVQAADHPEYLQFAADFHARAKPLLESVRDRGLADPATNAALARLSWQNEPNRTIRFASRVLDDSTATPDERTTALFTLGTTYFQQGRYDEAAPLLEELVQVRRYADAWHVLGICREKAGDLAGAVVAAEKAARISPIRPDFQQRLVEIYEQTNQPAQAETHRRRLNFLETYHRQHRP